MGQVQCARGLCNLMSQEMWQSHLPEDIQLDLPGKERKDIPGRLALSPSSIYPTADVSTSVTDD